MPGVGDAPGDWKQRARRAEAEADAARMLAQPHELDRLRDAAPRRVSELDEVKAERELAADGAAALACGRRLSRGD